VRARALLAMAAWSLSACSLNAPVVGERGPRVKDSSAEQAYQRVLDQNTARAEIYDGFDTRLFVGTTYQSADFRQQRVRREGLFQSQPDSVVSANLATEQAEAQQFDDFFLGVHLNQPQYDDFDRADSIWRVALVKGGVEVTPSQIQRVGRSNLNLRAYYPYLDEFWVAYRVRFPKMTGPGPELTLRLSSTLGKAELKVPAAN
jgi:hypothetical protein